VNSRTKKKYNISKIWSW